MRSVLRTLALAARLTISGIVMMGVAQATPSLLPVIATAYCSCQICTGKWSAHGLTASGRKPTPNHTIAADLKTFPLGTCLCIGTTFYHVEDSGKKIKDIALATGTTVVYRIDIFFASHEDAKRFGIKQLTATFCRKDEQ